MSNAKEVSCKIPEKAFKLLQIIVITVIAVSAVTAIILAVVIKFAENAYNNVYDPAKDVGSTWVSEDGRLSFSACNEITFWMEDGKRIESTDKALHGSIEIDGETVEISGIRIDEKMVAGNVRLEGYRQDADGYSQYYIEFNADNINNEDSQVTIEGSNIPGYEKGTQISLRKTVSQNPDDERFTFYVDMDEIIERYAEENT